MHVFHINSIKSKKDKEGNGLSNMCKCGTSTDYIIQKYYGYESEYAIFLLPLHKRKVVCQYLIDYKVDILKYVIQK